MDPIEKINNEIVSIIGFLDENGQPSLSSDVNRHFTKMLLLSSASYFEHEIRKILIDFIETKSGSCSEIVNLFKRKAIDRNYHTYFDWSYQDKPGRNANTFFSLFGDKFKLSAKKEIDENKDLSRSIEAFIEIGHLRNTLVHNNFAAFEITNKTSFEIFELHQLGKGFVDYIKNKLNNVCVDNDSMKRHENQSGDS
ncbi:MAG: hypothetical protein HQL89_03035 [Magnetococcales bacterium]|nr:hypothetical protein [Magnetococcales bacterium]